MPTPQKPSPLPGTVLITGAAKRLGAAMALGLGREGWKVIIHYRNSRQAAEEVVQQLRGQGASAWALQADLEDERACSQLIPRAIELAGPIHALINNASSFTASNLEDVTATTIGSNVQLNAVAPMLLARALCQQPEARRVINLLDSKITGPDDEHLAYHLSKRMLSDLTQLMARSFAPKVTVNAIAPGAILPAAGDSQTQFQELATSVPLQQTGTPEDILRAAKYLLDADFVTGQTLFVDGGRHMQGNLYG